MFNTIDIETYYDDAVGFSKQTTEEYIHDPDFEVLIIGLRTAAGQYIAHEACNFTSAQNREFLLDHKIDTLPLLGQNMRFDAAALSWLYGVDSPLILDTMLMARAAIRHRTGSTSLKVIAKHFGVGIKGEEVVAAKGKRRHDFSEQEWEDYKAYCVNDVELTYNLCNQLVPLIPKRELKVIHSTLNWYIKPKLCLDMTMLGDQVTNEKAYMQIHLKASGIDQKTLSSQPKFKAWLESQGVECPMKPSPSNPEKMIPALAKSDKEFMALTQHPTPAIAVACQARVAAKSRIKETRMERFVGIGQRNGGKIPVPLLCYGAQTQRYAGDESINMQNLPVAIRAGITAPPGYKIMSADQGQIEARINAVLSGQDDLIEGFRNGEDVYSDMATSIYGIPITEDTHPGERKVGKAIVLGAGYGMGGERCYDFLTGQWGIKGISAEFAMTCVNTYRTRMHHIVSNWKTVNALLATLVYGGEAEYGPVIFRHEEVELPSGMKLYYPDITHDGKNYQYRRYDRKTRKWNWVKIYGAMMVENICQALARELLTEQMLLLEKKWDSVHQIHDEGWFLVPEDEEEVACKVAQKIMTIPPSWMPNLPLKVEPTTAYRASDLK